MSTPKQCRNAESVLRRQLHAPQTRAKAACSQTLLQAFPCQLEGERLLLPILASVPVSSLQLPDH